MAASDSEIRNTSSHVNADDAEAENEGRLWLMEEGVGGGEKVEEEKG